VGGRDAAAPRARVAALEEERSWLRTISTSPLRPRLATDVEAEPPDDLQPHNPRIRIDAPVADAEARVRATEGVAVTATVHVGEVAVRHRGGPTRLEVAFVDPETFRVVTPEVTATAEPLWRALADGELALTHGTARELGVRAGTDVGLGGFLRRSQTRVAGLVSLGRAGIAEALLHEDARAAVDPDAERVLLVGVERLDELEAVLGRLERAGVGEVAPLPDIEPYRAELVGDDDATVAAFEPFTFHQRDGGRIRIDPAWVEANIVSVELPLLGRTRCHHLIVPQLQAALEELIDRGLDEHVDGGDYGGCWVPRHISSDSTRGLSLHAWGIAFDVNVSTNAYGADPELDPRVIEVFERYGFNWGGRWDPPDGMHFELGRLLDPADVPAVAG
jgi:hypothetical protein